MRLPVASLSGPTVALGVLLATAAPFAQSAAKVYGAATPQDVVAGLNKAAAAKDFAAAMPLISPAGRKELASEGVAGVLMIVALSDPDDPMPGGPKLSKTELDAKRKNYKAAVDLARQTLKPHGMDTLIGKPAMAPDTEKAIAAALDKTDTVVLMTSLLSAMDKMGPMLGMKKNDKPDFPFTLGAVTDYKVTGDKAVAKAGKDPIDFVRIDGRWYLTPPPAPPGK